MKVRNGFHLIMSAELVSDLLQEDGSRWRFNCGGGLKYPSACVLRYSSSMTKPAYLHGCGANSLSLERYHALLCTTNQAVCVYVYVRACACMHAVCPPALEVHDLLLSLLSTAYLFTRQDVLQYLFCELILSRHFSQKH